MARKLVILLVGQAALVGLFFLLRPSLPFGGPQVRVIDVAIRDGVMTPGEIVVDGGDQVVLRIIADRALRLHLHGYDLQQRTLPGDAVTLEFAASYTGRYLIEDEDSQGALGTVVVRPRGER